MKSLRKMSREIPRFILVGLMSSLINYITYYLAWNVGASPIAASIAGYALGLYNSYHFGRRWVFDFGRERHGLTILRFAFVYSLGGLGMAAIIEGLNRLYGWDYRLVWFAGAAFAFLNNYFGSKWFVFKKVERLNRE